MNTEKNKITSCTGNVYDEKDYCIIEIVAEKIKGETKDGKKYDFLSFHTFDKKGKRAKIKFTKKAKNIPDEVGIYEAVIHRDNINRDKQAKYYEVWVKDVTELNEYIPQFKRDDIDF